MGNCCVSIRCLLAVMWCWICYTTSEAAGQNMTTISTKMRVILFLRKRQNYLASPITLLSLTIMVIVVSQRNLTLGRGHQVVAAAIKRKVPAVF